MLLTNLVNRVSILRLKTRSSFPPFADSRTSSRWQKIDRVGHTVEAQLQHFGVGLTIGGEPTFVSLTDFESPQWRTAALGDDKRRLAGQLLQRLAQRFGKPGGLPHYGLGKCYPGENAPRWALGYYWRQDGVPIWNDRCWLSEDGKSDGYDRDVARQFVDRLSQTLGVPRSCIRPAYEAESSKISGYLLPLLPTVEENRISWHSCQWTLPEEKLTLLSGDLALGLRLPLRDLPPLSHLLDEAILPLGERIQPAETPVESPADTIRIALCVEVRSGTLYVFMPPLTGAASFLNLVEAVETTAAETGLNVALEGYPPPGNAGIDGFCITPDPGVVEVNIHPAKSWDELVDRTTVLYEEARNCGLGTEKFDRDGRRVSTGGGAHITLGGQTTQRSPLLRRPDLLRSLLSYWQNHPSLSYLFSGKFVGPTSQSPRLDEARHESLYELEIAFAQLERDRDISPWSIDRLLRNLLVDMTGNTHRTAFCIDKLFPVENPRQQLGLLELRSIAMPPTQEMRLLQLLLVRAFVAWFWQVPYTEPLTRWGTTLHDRFMLPHYLELDFRSILQDLQNAGYAFEFDWFVPFFEFRFPRYGTMTRSNVTLEIRHAIEPWNVLGEEISNQGTARYVDDSMERIQVKLSGEDISRYTVTCNGYPVPLGLAGSLGEVVGGVRFRARTAEAVLHPSIEPHAPLQFEIVDLQTHRSIGGCTYFVTAPDGTLYSDFPKNAEDARSRRDERFIARDVRSEPVTVPQIIVDREFPMTLDLRRVTPISH
ncbi:MAG: transglutaminase family protein [Cyanobacteria bacterium SBC]|nr:transglutaminase family protein [Cyanobacteria bacterium SBC]